MDLAGLLAAGRRRLNDEAAEYLWSDAELTDALNEAVNEASIRARLNLDSTTAAVTQVSVVAGTASYPIHSSILSIERAYLPTSGKVLEKTSFHDLDRESETWPTTAGVPSRYVLDLDHNTAAASLVHRMTLYPIPESSETLYLTVYRLPIAPMVIATDEPELPAVHHPYLVDWACHLAYLRNDVDSVSLEKALVYEQRFERRFGPRPDARQLEYLRKQRPRRVIGRWL